MITKYRIISTTDRQHVGEVVEIDMAQFALTRTVTHRGREIGVDRFFLRSDGKYIAANSNYTVVLEAYSG